MESNTEKDLESIVQRVFLNAFSEKVWIEGVFDTLEEQERHIKDNFYDPEFMRNYRQLVEKVRALIITALIEAAHIIDERGENEQYVDRLFGNISKARRAFNRTELAEVIYQSHKTLIELNVRALKSGGNET
ncbi:MAG: hypothetical protein JWO06_747 [Bacteroidota bacterium]|nr:hypothetical protein [Bacteroidota bacterium]